MILSRRICIPNKTKDVTLNVFNTITWLNWSKTLPKHVSHDCKRKLDSEKFNSNKKGNSNNWQ